MLSVDDLISKLDVGQAGDVGAKDHARETDMKHV